MAYRILLVEDYEETRTAVACLLKMSGYEVDTAANGRGAVDLLAERRYDVVVSDVQMPRMDGEELYRHIENEWPRLARSAVFMTAHPRLSGRAGFGATFVPVLRKPFAAESLRQAVASAIERAASP